MNRPLIAVLAAMIAAACTVEPQGGAPGDGSVRLTAGIEAGGDVHFLWADGDVINANGTLSNALPGGAGGSSNAEFTFPEISAPYRAIYPGSVLSSYSDGKATIEIPREQKYSGDGYDTASWIMTSRSINQTLSFRPRMALLTVLPSEAGSDIASVTVSGFGSEAMSGTFSTDFNSITPASGASASVTVSYPEGIPQGQPWNIVIPARDYTGSGFTVKVNTVEGRSIERSFVPDEAYAPGNNYICPIDLTPGSGALFAQVCTVSSSTISYSWYHEGSSDQEDISRPYLISLYSDAACTNLIVSHQIPAGAACWKGTRPRFIFGGLKPSTKYWFTVRDTQSGSTSSPVSAFTGPFSTDDYILAEDFSEIGWGASEFDLSAGFYPAVKDLTVPSGALSSADGSYAAFDEGDASLFSGTSIPAESRLSGWSFAGDNLVFARAGHLQVGTSASGTRTFIVSPPLAGIPEGEEAVVEVTVTSGRNEDSKNDVAIFLEHSRNEGITLTTAFPLGSGYGGWSTSTLRVGGVRNTSVLAIGSLNNIDTKNSFCISDIRVRVLSKEEAGSDVRIKVASYNVLKPSGHPEQSSLDKQEVRDAICSNVAATGASIIGFNELDSNYIPGGTYDLTDICRTLSGNWKWHIEWPNNIRLFKSFTYTYANGFAYDSTVLSLEDCGYVWLSKEENTWYANWWAAYDRCGSPMRTCVWALMRHNISGKRFYFLVTHLPTESQGGAESMAAGVNAFAQSLEPGIPIILTGDMNCAPSGSTAPAYDKLREYWADACETVAASGGNDMTTRGTLSGSSSSYYYSVSTFSRNHPERRIDHVMTSGSCTAVKYDLPYVTFTADGAQWCPSDHLAVAATIELAVD